MVSARTLVILLALGLVPGALARDWYVSASTGRGKKGTREAPAKGLDHVASRLEPGDRVFMAGGVYLGKGERGWTTIEVPVEVYGGYAPDFSARDPWGAHRTVLAGDNRSENFGTRSRLEVTLEKWRDGARWPEGEGRYAEPAHRIVIDGLIFDNGPRNRYRTDRQRKIVRLANPASGQGPSPSTPALRVVPWRRGEVVVRHCVALNVGASQGVFSIWGNKGSRVLLEDNLAVNNTGNGIHCLSVWHPQDGADLPHFVVRRNTVAFTEDYDAYGDTAGSALALDRDLTLEATGNLLAHSDAAGLDNQKQAEGLVLRGNRIFAAARGAYLEGRVAMDLAEVEDEAEGVEVFEGNRGEPVSADFLAAYRARAVLDRDALEAKSEAGPSPPARPAPSLFARGLAALWSGLDALRRMAGGNPQGATVTADSEVWLPRIQLDDALAVGQARVEGAGCAAPAAGR